MKKINNSMYDCDYRLLRNLIIILIIISILALSDKLIVLSRLKDSHESPNYKFVNIDSILNKEKLDIGDYKFLFLQTGLAPKAIDTLLEDNINGKKKIKNIQKNFFKSVDVLPNKIALFTYEETISSDINKKVYNTELAPYKEGYILLTKSTYTCGWRHGHAALITDSKDGYILEAAIVGQKPQFSDIKKFLLYPNFILLKPKNFNDNQLKQISSFASKNLLDIPYRISSGILIPKYIKNKLPIGTQCSHLVWYTYKVFGIDIDSNKGLIVTPNDIANSDNLEIVQIYGINPYSIWK